MFNAFEMPEGYVAQKQTHVVLAVILVSSDLHRSGNLLLCAGEKRNLVLLLCQPCVCANSILETFVCFIRRGRAFDTCKLMAHTWQLLALLAAAVFSYISVGTSTQLTPS